jgi:hypothetical protein
MAALNDSYQMVLVYHRDYRTTPERGSSTAFVQSVDDVAEMRERCVRDSRTKEQIRRLRRVRSCVGVDTLDSRLLNSQFFGFWHDFQSEATNAWFG